MTERAWFTATIDEIRQDQAKYVAIRQAIDTGTAHLEQALKKTFAQMWADAFGGTHVENSCSTKTGSHTDDWNPRVYLRSVDGCLLADKGYWISRASEPHYAFNTVKVPAPVDMVRFQEFLIAFERLTATKIQVSYAKIQDAPICIRTTDDVRAIYGPEFEVLAQGDVWHRGWDIADHYVVGKLNGVYIARCSTDGHGGGMTREAKTQAEFEGFFSFLRDRGDNLEDKLVAEILAHVPV